MKLLLDNKDYSIILFGKIIYIKVFGFQTLEEIAPLTNSLNKFSKKYEGEEISVYCDLSELILSEYTTALEVNKTIQNMVKHVNVKHMALLFINSYSSYKYEFTKHFYFKDLKFPIEAFISKKDALAWLKEKGDDINDLSLFLTD